MGKGFIYHHYPLTTTLYSQDMKDQPMCGGAPPKVSIMITDGKDDIISHKAGKHLPPLPPLLSPIWWM